MTQEQFIPSLETKPFGTPLRKFEGILKGYNSEKKMGTGEGAKEYMVINFDFTDLVVMESTEPYPHPIATLSISYSTSTESKWDALAKSIKKVMGLQTTIDQLVGKKQVWSYLPATLRTLIDGEWKNAELEAWQLASIDGASTSSGATDSKEADARILELLDGKTEQDFYQEFYQDDIIRGHPELIEAATQRTLLPALQKAGKINRDAEGIWHTGPGTGSS